MPLPDVGAPALTTIRFDLAAATGAQHPAAPARLAPGTWTFTPWPAARSTTTRLLPRAFQVRPTAEEIAAGFFLLGLYATADAAWATPWCWKVREPWPGTTRYLTVPAAALALEYAALVEVDPDTLTALPGSAAGALAVLSGADADRDHLPDWWEALVRDQTTRIADLEAAVLALQARQSAAGTPLSAAQSYTTTAIGDSPAAVETYIDTRVEEPAAASGLIGSTGLAGGWL